ncbi:MAG: HNH endonuclease [Anaerolineae bacterium]|nr:HNH endonuclease [Anaerolineae bacterium]
MDHLHTRRCIRCGQPIRDPQALLYCEACRETEWGRERQRVQAQNARAAAAGLPADLTLEAWLQTVADFNGLCAYCQARPFEHLEHFIPIDAGGGTTIGNVVPACGRCNWSKGSDDPDQPQPALFASDPRERVRTYLAARGEADTPFYYEED